MVTDYPNYVSKNQLTENGFTNYEYVFTTGAYNNKTVYRSKYPPTSKPKILITTSTHGSEKGSVMSLYEILKDVCNGTLPLSDIHESIELRVIPLVCPWGYTNTTRWNENGVNINRNFTAGWTAQGEPFDSDYSGPSAASENETKLIETWLSANSDAKLYIDWHNSGYGNEVSYLSMASTCTNFADMQKAYRYGIDDITAYWMKDRSMTDSTLVYQYTGSVNIGGSAEKQGDATGLTSATLETASNQNEQGKWSAFSIGVGAEAAVAFLTKVIDFLREL